MKNNIAIIVGNYNMATTIERTILSILNQTYKSVDLHISDNHSTDNSWEILNKYKQNYQNVYIYKPEEHCSIAIHSNFLIKILNSFDYKYVAFISADDFLDSTFIEKCYGMYSSVKGQLGYVYTERNSVENNKIKKDIPFYKDSAIIKSHEQFKIDIKGYRKVFSQILFNTKIFIQNFGNDFSITSDVSLILKINSKYDVGYIKEPLCYYSVNGVSETGTQIKNKIMPCLIYAAKMDAIRHHCPKELKESKEKLIEYLNYFMIKYCIQFIPTFIQNKDKTMALEYLYLALGFYSKFKDSELFKYLENQILEEESINIDKMTKLKKDFFIYEQGVGTAPYSLPNGSIVLRD